MLYSMERRPNEIDFGGDGGVGRNGIKKTIALKSQIVFCFQVFSHPSRKNKSTSVIVFPLYCVKLPSRRVIVISA